MTRRMIVVLAVLLALVLAACGERSAPPPEKQPPGKQASASNDAQSRTGGTAVPQAAGGTVMALKITSTAFKSEGMIPAKYTCDGDDVSPPLSWSGVPDGAKSLALIADDPDAPRGMWVHWVLFNLPPDTRDLPEHVPADKVLKNGARQGMSDFKRIGYGGPCPPSGVHRYYLKLYALDAMLTLDAGATKQDLLDAMKGHVLAEGQLMGK